MVMASVGVNLPSGGVLNRKQSVGASLGGFVRPPTCDRKRFEVRAFQTKADRGYSGLDVNGQRPTSPKAWTAIKAKLQESKVKLISQQELLWAQERGVPVIDIRPQAEYERGHIPGAVNIPLYQLISGWDSRSILRRAGFAFFGVFNGTELNPMFHSDMAAATSPDIGAILVCNMGGAMNATETNATGMQSRSLVAAYEVTNLGIANVCVLRGGFSEWRRNNRAIAEGRAVDEGEGEIAEEEE